MTTGLERLGDLTPWMQQQAAKLLRFAERNGIPVTEVASTRRSCAQQDSIYAQGRESEGPIATQAHGCQSWHVWGRAVDLVVAGGPSEYAVLGDEWKRMGGLWGGDFSFKDFGHFEWHPDISMHELCPTGEGCPSSTAPWDDDRPLLAKPLVQGLLGLALAGAGLAAASYLTGRRRFLGLRLF
jgi:peptidoglycan L-alanyl-D-glutamate endopeptidase CwlK